MKPIKITTRKIDKLRERVQNRDDHIDRLTRSRREVSQWIYDDRAALRDKIEALQADDAAAAESLLSNVNGNAKAHTLGTFRDVSDIAQRAERQLDAAGLPLADRAGVEVSFRPAGPAAKAYKYEVTTTRVKLRRVADGWRLVSASRDSARPKQAELFEIRLSKAQRDRVAEIALRPFGEI